MLVNIMGKDGLKIVDLNRRKAIHERCLDCSCWIPSEVTNCTFTDCPLYDFRTGTGKQDSVKRNKSIKKYCLWCQGGHAGEIPKCVSPHCALFPYRMSKTDRSVEINSDAEKDHIEALSEIKIDEGTLSMHTIN